MKKENQGVWFGSKQPYFREAQSSASTCFKFPFSPRSWEHSAWSPSCTPSFALTLSHASSHSACVFCERPRSNAENQQRSQKGNAIFPNFRCPGLSSIHEIMARPFGKALCRLHRNSGSRRVASRSWLNSYNVKKPVF